MPVSLKELDKALKILLKPEQFDDYCPNGLQVEGKANISRLVSGVTASMALIEAAIEENADFILVHHGYFWKGENLTITGLKKARLQMLLLHNISLCAYHLPIDAHPNLGNNAQLAKVLGFTKHASLDNDERHPIIFSGNLEVPMSFDEFSIHIESKLKRTPLAIKGKSNLIESIAWCTGAAQGFIEIAMEAGVDAYITGEVSEQTVHIAREAGLHFFSAGHHATERYGIQAVGSYMAEKFNISHKFIDIDNPA